MSYNDDWYESEDRHERGKALIGTLAIFGFILFLIFINSKACAQDTTLVVNPDGNRWRVQTIQIPVDTLADPVVIAQTARMTRARINTNLVNRMVSTRGRVTFRAIRVAYHDFNGSSIYQALPADFFAGEWLKTRAHKSRVITLLEGGTIQGGGSWNTVGVNMRIKLPGKKPVYLQILTRNRMRRGPILLKRQNAAKQKGR